ncbi:arsenite methyltransferase [Dehalobacter sp. DCM]|uniref:arsenite methyltransferase n=1 Tax=Dehalobacter sp. DCM TaxID=2907827 RepID=UPI0030821F41|nr:arsenite methyltransferase [Dehalobacter sp. DCM]
MNEQEIHQLVSERYGAHAKGDAPAKTGNLLDMEGRTQAKAIGYTEEDLAGVPEGADLCLGCGAPLFFLSLKEGDTVLDLGSGGGIDCFVAARRVGKSGKVIGIDLTPEMVKKARKNAGEGGYTNVEFILGEVENLPLADKSVDAIISNCVLNLVPDKAKAYAEAVRVLRLGGSICLSDIVTVGRTSRKLRSLPKAYAACLSGAIPKQEYLSLMEQAGFTDITVAQEKKWPFFNNFASIQVTACLK